MSLFANSIGSKTNFVRTDEPNDITAETTFDNNVIFNNGVSGLDITDIDNLQTELEDKASVEALQSETDQRINADILLNDAILLKASQTDLTTEENTRAIADNNILNNLNDEIQNRTLSDNALAGLILQRATIISLNAEITTRTNADTNLQNNINTETQGRLTGDTNLESAINTEAQQRINADNELQTQINLRLTEANSVFFPNHTKYVVDNRDNIQEVINSITFEGSVVYFSSGSIGGTGLVIDKKIVAFIAPKANPAILELVMPVTTAITADRLRFSNIQFEGAFIAGSSRSVYTDCDFQESLNILASQTAGFMTFNRCEFVAGKEINVANNFASVIFFIDCNFSGAVFSLNQFSNQQVIFSNCGGFVSFPSNAFFAGINALTTGYIQNSISKTILPIGSGSSGQVLTSGGAGGIDTWATPSAGGSSPIIESFTRYTQGQVVSTSKGNITLPNITTQQQVTSNPFTWTELLGSNINYTPPTGSTFVEFELDFYCYGFTPSVANETFFSVALYIDNVEQKITRQRIILAAVPFAAGQKNYKFKSVISITGATDPNKVSLNSWTTNRNVKIMLLKEQNNRSLTLHFLDELFIGGSDPVQTTIIPPLLKITAY